MFFSLYHILALVLVISVHECAHAWMAMRLGDPSAQRLGRITLNPLKHLDILGTVMLFMAGFGWGKPVPVNPNNFKNPVRDQAITAFAGPFANLCLAILFAIPFTYLSGTGFPFSAMVEFSGAVFEISLILFLFNLLPFPPLDGADIFAIFIPKKHRAEYKRLSGLAMPYFVVFMICDIYLLNSIFGFSIIWNLISGAFFGLKTVILLLI